MSECPAGICNERYCDHVVVFYDDVGTTMSGHGTGQRPSSHGLAAEGQK